MTPPPASLASFGICASEHPPPKKNQIKKHLSYRVCFEKHCLRCFEQVSKTAPCVKALASPVFDPQHLCDGKRATNCTHIHNSLPIIPKHINEKQLKNFLTDIAVCLVFAYCHLYFCLTICVPCGHSILDINKVP